MSAMKKVKQIKDRVFEWNWSKILQNSFVSIVSLTFVWGANKMGEAVIDISHFINTYKKIESITYCTARNLKKHEMNDKTYRDSLSVVLWQRKRFDDTCRIKFADIERGAWYRAVKNQEWWEKNVKNKHHN